MNKKGVSLQVNMIIIIVLGLIALVIAIVFLRTQITKGAEKYEEIGAALEKCEGLFKNRECMASCPSPEQKVRPIGSGWADCGKGEKIGKPDCCEV